MGEEDGEGKFGPPKRNWYTRQTEFSHVTRQQMGLLSIGETISNFKKNKKDAVGTFPANNFIYTRLKHHRQCKPNECVCHDGDRDNKEPQITAASGFFVIIIMSDSAGPVSKESAPAITAPAPLSAAPAPSTVAQSFTSNGTVNNNVMSIANGKLPAQAEPAAAAASASTGASASASAHINVCFHNNGIVNNNVAVFKIPGNKSLPERNVKQTLDGTVYLPDKFVPE
jgi:hypothetical protein